MPRKKPSYRDTLDRLDAAFPGKEIIQKKELSQFLGLDVRTVKKYFSTCESKLHPGYSKTKVARILAD